MSHISVLKIVLLGLCLMIQLSTIRTESAAGSKDFYLDRIVERSHSVNDPDKSPNHARNSFYQVPILSLSDGPALRKIAAVSNKRTPNQFKNFMLNKDKVDEVGTNLDAAKNERSLYIPRAVIKRLNSARFMPFGARNIVPDGTARNDDMANVLFYVVLNQQRAFAEPNEFK